MLNGLDGSAEAGICDPAAMVWRGYALARRCPCRMLLVSAYQSTTARTLSMPRTVNCLRSQLRQRAWMHSQIERALYCALPASLAMRARQAKTPGPSPLRGKKGSTPLLDLVGGQ